MFSKSNHTIVEVANLLVQYMEVECAIVIKEHQMIQKISQQNDSAGDASDCTHACCIFVVGKLPSFFIFLVSGVFCSFVFTKIYDVYGTVLNFFTSSLQVLLLFELSSQSLLLTYIPFNSFCIVNQ